MYFECIQTTILDVYSNIIININSLDIMVTINGIYIFSISKLNVRYLLNILCPYYKFIQTIYYIS